MSKFKLINIDTKEEHLCDKITIDGFDYYVNESHQQKGDPIIHKTYIDKLQYAPDEYGSTQEHWWKVIATNNPNIDIPKIVDEVGKAWEEVANSYNHKNSGVNPHAFRLGYNKYKETHPFSEEDVRFMLSESFKASHEGYRITSDEIIRLCKEQRPKILYYR